MTEAETLNPWAPYKIEKLEGKKNPELPAIIKQLQELSDQVALQACTYDPKTETYSVLPGSNPNASETGYIVPGMYGTWKERLKTGTMFIARDENNKVIGFIDLELYPKGEPDENSFVFTDDENGQALQKLLPLSHAEFREIVVAKGTKKILTPHQLLQQATEFAKSQGMAGITTWILMDGEANIPNQRSMKQALNEGFKVGAKTIEESALAGAEAVCLFKTF